MKISRLFLLVFLLASSDFYAQTIRYVTQNGAGNQTGSSWENASNDLQAMINASSSGDQIYVAVGTYVPNRRADATGTITLNNRYNSFVMKQGVSIYGGFDPANGITDDLNLRILPGTGSGSLLSGNLGNINSIEDNAYHVVVAAGGSDAGMLDGFIIQDGNARGSNNMTVNEQSVTSKGGGGIAVVNTEVKFTNCWIRGNLSNSGGGVYIAMANTSLSFTSHFTNCIFSGNYVSKLSGHNGNGGAIYSLNGRARLYNCTISSNRASGGRGGAILSSGNIYLNNSILHGNTAGNGQNGVRIDGGSFVAQYSLIGDSGDSPTSSTNVTSGNPSFVNEAGTSTMPNTGGNYQLNPNSSCIDTGNNSIVPSGIVTHIGGFTRVQNGTVDRGAFETQASLTLYVKAGGTGSGLSWAEASGDLQLTINQARSGDIIFVAGGTYKPNRRASALNVITPNDRDNAFVLKNNVKIYGGFAGTETSLSQRDLSNPANKTILSGDFNNNDVVSGSGASLNISGNGENAYHVVIAAGNLGTSTVLDGFIITGGNANGANDITVNGDVISKYNGGGIYSRTSSPIIRNSLIRYNQASQGAGMVRYNGSPQIINCVFDRNRASTAGSALRLIYSSGNITIINSSFFGNRDNGFNGVIFKEAPVIMYNSIVYGNNSGIGGPGSFTQTYSLVQGQSSTSDGNINGNTNPQFINPENGDFRLQLISPVANRGNNAYVPTSLTTDIAGNTRIQDCAVDMGAYESDPIPAPVAEDQALCAGTTVSDLTATGENLQWYDVAEGGSPLDENLELATGTYYVSQTINDCESPRTGVSVTVYGISPIPVADTDQIFCAGTISDLTATGENLQWYNVAEGGLPLDENIELTTGTYYVSQTINGCESLRTEVSVTVYGVPIVPVADTDQRFCTGNTVTDLTATGENLQWYDVAEGGLPLDENMELATGTYYVSQTINDCESPRTEVSVMVYGIPPSPSADTNQIFCAGNTVSDLTATGENLLWYDVAEGGAPLSSDTEIVAGTYYVSQTINGCEGPRTEVSVTYSVEAPTAPSPQSFSFSGVVVSELEATGENLQWYNVATGGETLANSETLTTGTYYVSQTIDGCESGRTAVSVSIANIVRYVKPVASGSGDGSNWANASNDLQAMINASSSGDYIFVAKGTYKPNRKANAVGTITPNHVHNAFVLKNGVKIYGNFAGTETSLEQRDLSVTANKSILSGDFNNDDTVSGSGSSLQFSNNAENACHVIISAGTISPETVLDGFTITKGGNINVHPNITVNGVMIPSSFGGGLFNVNSTPTISNCIFTRNYGYWGGGAVYSDGGSSSAGYPTFINCIFSKNLSIGYNHNGYGGAVQSAGVSRYFNCTFWGNRADFGGGIYINSGSVTLRNSIVYGNSSGIQGNFFRTYSLVQGQSSTSNGNINGNTNPLFVNPSGGNFSLQLTSPVINRGNNSNVPSNTTTDIAGNPRIQLGTVDMGAYEADRAGTIWTISNNWLNNVEPDEEKDVFIEGDLSVGTDYGSFSSNSLTVEDGGSLTIQEGNSITARGKITNYAGEGNFKIESGGNLIQTSDYETDDNEGKITVERDSQPIVRLDYTFWSSPVKGQQIQSFSPMTLPNRIYTYETNSGNQETNGAYEAVSNVNSNFIQGKGYLFRAPNDWIPEDSETGEIYTGKFIGEPTNGNISIPTYANGFTSVGNPYPSNIDPEKLMAANPNLSNLFFWNNPERVQDEDGNWGYAGNRYIAYSILGFNHSDYEGKSISSGQGFIVYTTNNEVNFDNSMRVSSEESFFKTDQTERHRFWLQLSNDQGHTLNQILIGYMTGATNGIDQKIEGEQFGYAGSAIYNLINEQKYAIQGRALPFEITDVVPLGFNAEKMGKYKISLADFDGLFAGGNTKIYLRDKAMDITQNLLESDYEFQSEQGEFHDRFEIVYEKEETMGTDSFAANSIQIYQHEQNIIIESKAGKILSVELFDLQGRKLYANEKVNAAYYQIPSERFGSAVLLIRVLTENGEIETKKMLNK